MWFRLLIMVVVALLAIYYLMVILQLFGILSMTNRKFTFTRCITPFYYWIASVEEPKKPTKKRVKAIKTTTK